MPITDFIGVAFDDISPWGKCTIGELKGLIYLALGDLDKAKYQVESFNHYNDNTPSRIKFYKILDVVLDILIHPQLEYGNYKNNLEKMYGKDILEAAHGSATGKIKFYGLNPTDLNLSGIKRHTQLVESYKKIHKARSR